MHEDISQITGTSDEIGSRIASPCIV
jgi:hypothetical protein